MKSWLVLIILAITVWQPGCKSQNDDSGMEGLLSDSELVTSADPNAAHVEDIWTYWIKDKHVPIRSLSADNHTDLQFLKFYLGNRRLVQLGESGHGVREFNQMKVRLIRFLHQEMDFDVIAFESSIFDCFYANEFSAEMDANDMMLNSIYMVWHTQEVLELFNYIKESQDTDRPLILAGFDMKRSGGAYDERARFFYDVILPFNPGYADQILDFDNEYIIGTKGKSWEEWQQYIKSRKEELLAFYRDLLTFFDENMEKLSELHSQNPLIPLVARQQVWCIIQFVHFSQAETGTQQTTLIRDSAMAANLRYLANTMYPDKKIMVWAHNFHIRHDGEGVNPNPVRTMGSWIFEKFSPELYTIGLYMYQGTAAYNDRRVYTINPPTTNSLEAICYQARCKYLFFDMLNQSIAAVNSWMFMPICAKDWGLFCEQMVVRDQYNGIIFIHTVSPPDYTYSLTTRALRLSTEPAYSNPSPSPKNF